MACVTEDGARRTAVAGEPVDAVARDSQVPAHELEEWRRVFLDGGTQGLKKRVDPEDRELKRVQAKLGEVMMRLELAEDLIEKKRVRGGVAEARAMSTQTSGGTGRRYPLTMVCAVYRVPRTTVYAQTTVTVGIAPGKRWPHTPGTDVDLVLAIRTVLADTPFHGEGHRKVRVRVRALGWRVGKNRILRLMRAHRLLAPQRTGHPHGDPAHAGTITTERPNVMWGTDATRFYTEREGWCWFFGAIDHASDDIVGWHVAKLGDRWAALEPIHQGVRMAFGGFEKDIARGLAIRSDWGPQYVADAFRAALGWLGITHSPSYVGEPQCNGVIERFMRTLKEQCIWLHRFATLDEARTIIGAFLERYNHQWLIERLDHRTPAVARREMLAAA
jgi:putative transposase